MSKKYRYSYSTSEGFKPMEDRFPIKIEIRKDPNRNYVNIVNGIPSLLIDWEMKEWVACNKDEIIAAVTQTLNRLQEDVLQSYWEETKIYKRNDESDDDV